MLMLEPELFALTFTDKSFRLPLDESDRWIERHPCDLLVTQQAFNVSAFLFINIISSAC